MNKGSEFTMFMKTSVYSLQTLRQKPHQRIDVASILDPLGSRLETFLRTVALPSAPRGDRLVQLIGRLPNEGLDQGVADALDALRLLYNRSKHSPTEPLALGYAIEVVADAVSAVEEITVQSIGASDEPFALDLNYYLYVGFWDHYTTGEIEAAICLPGEHWTHVATVDTFNFNFSSWDQIRVLLEAHPRFQFGQDKFSADVWESFKKEDDFLNAGVWEGDYGELVRLLARFDDRQLGAQLIPGLARASSKFSTHAAIIASTVDVARSGTAFTEIDTLACEILRVADKSYAVPSDTEYVKAAAAQSARLLATIDENRWIAVSGPVFASASKTSTQTSPSEPMPLSIDGNAFILACLP